MGLERVLRTDLVFVLAWAFPLLAVILYRARGIPLRLKEIEEVFLGPPQDGSGVSLEATPGCQYLKLFRSLKYQKSWTRESVMCQFREHFYRWHSWGRYLLPLTFIAVISAVELDFCRDWAMMRLGVGSADSTRIATSVSVGGGGADTAQVLAAVSVSGGDSSPSKPKSARVAWFPTLSPKQMARVPASIVLALLGAFMWSVYEILSRRYSRDLTPQELLEITFRLIAAVPIGYAFSQIAAGSWDAPLAFAASAFPIRDLKRMMRERGLAKESQVSGSEKSPTANLAQVIDGISNETAARLEELNITSSWDLAYADPVALMARTGYSLRVILAWLDQALLIVYFDGKKTVLRDLAFPCALDLSEFFKRHCWDAKAREIKDCSQDVAVKDLAAKLEIPASILPERIYALFTDPHVQFLDATWYSDAPKPVPAGAGT